ncbi:hypothetical protein [Rhizobium ruizarguesonis]|uniref:hypothetical protein n=1 Tax=Rhizobium ruizarguesonis TaxID=2081791 RepID=UPI00040B562A|nr:hypothetical protein [Rhizobium ruizarguesonis]
MLIQRPKQPSDEANAKCGQSRQSSPEKTLSWGEHISENKRGGRRVEAIVTPFGYETRRRQTPP